MMADQLELLEKAGWADQLLADDRLEQFMSTMEDEVYLQWKNSAVDATDEREALYHQIRALNDLRSKLLNAVSAGEYIRHQRGVS